MVSLEHSRSLWSFTFSLCHCLWALQQHSGWFYLYALERFLWPIAHSNNPDAIEQSSTFMAFSYTGLSIQVFLCKCCILHHAGTHAEHLGVSACPTSSLLSCARGSCQEEVDPLWLPGLTRWARAPSRLSAQPAFRTEEPAMLRAASVVSAPRGCSSLPPAGASVSSSCTPRVRWGKRREPFHVFPASIELKWQPSSRAGLGLTGSGRFLIY